MGRAPTRSCLLFSAGDIERTQQLAAALHSLADEFVRDVDPAGTTATVLPYMNGELDQAAVARLLR